MTKPVSPNCGLQTGFNSPYFRTNQYCWQIRKDCLYQSWFDLTSEHFHKFHFSWSTTAQSCHFVDCPWWKWKKTLYTHIQITQLWITQMYTYSTYIWFYPLRIAFKLCIYLAMKHTCMLVQTSCHKSCCEDYIRTKDNLFYIVQEMKYYPLKQGSL